MTTEIEKTFFDTFGIEPKLKTFAIQKDEQGELTYPPIYEYPQISDRVLLKLICIANEAYIDLEGTDIETMKNSLLENFIFFRRDVYDQVRTLFEEG